MRFKKSVLAASIDISALSALGCALFLGGCSRQDEVVEQQPQAQQQQPQATVDPQAADAPQYAICLLYTSRCV